MDLDVEYDNTGRVPEAAEIIKQWGHDAQAYRAKGNARLDVAYGEHERQKVDVFGYSKADKKPLIIFIHGGYWRALGRESFSHMARGLNDLGFGVLVPSYQLCPTASIADIITDLRLLCAWAWREFDRKLIVTGHSAGGHLAASMVATNWGEYDLPSDLVNAGLGISGLYDLRPLLPIKLNETLGLDEASARQNSPLLWPSPTGKRFEAWVGGDESAEYIRQNDTITACWKGAGIVAGSVTVANKNHFTVIEDLTKADSNMTKMLASLAS